MGHGRLDSILDSYSIQGIDPPNPSKNIGSDVPNNKEKGECTVTNLAYGKEIQFTHCNKKLMH
jgi:hypothetical protein